MEPEIWGPNAWLFLHTVTFNYPKNPTVIDRNNYYDFFNSLQNVLPCQKCQEHYKLNLQKSPIQLQSRRHLVQWLINMHNAVNIKNGKEVWTYDEVYDEMKKWKDTIVWDQEALNALVKKKCDNYIDLGRCWNTMSSNIQTVTYGLHYINWHKRRFTKKLIEEYEMKMHSKEHYIDQKVNTFPIFWKRFDGNIISAEKAYDRIMNNMQIS